MREAPCERERLVAVQIFDEFVGAVRASWVENVCHTVLEHEGVKQEVSLVITDDEMVRALNAKYRGLDEATDVLSFAFNNQGEYYGAGEAPSEWMPDDGFVLPPGVSTGLGEVIISYPQALVQARCAGHSVERELARLITHGILHLMGHDHMLDDEEQEMNAKENSVAERLSVADLDAHNEIDGER